MIKIKKLISSLIFENCTDKFKFKQLINDKNLQKIS